MPAPSSGVQTTAPSSSETFESSAEKQVSSLALVCTWSLKEPERVGEIGFLRPFEWIVLGRPGGDDKDRQHFARQLPGEPPHDFSRGECLTGEALSREQALMRATAVAIELVNTGKCPLLVNGVEVPRFKGDPTAALNTPGAVARLQPGDTVYCKGHVAWVCVRRHRTLPLPGEGYKLAPFGEASADGVVGESEPLWKVMKELMDAADGKGHVLVLGESGTGKEMTARFIHDHSKRVKGRFLSAVGIAETLPEGELFGTIANYPNPGTPARKGLFGETHEGTLFLDELCDLPLRVQIALRHTLQYGEYRSVGDDRARVSSARVVGATSRAVALIDKDLYNRFAVHITMPPLRERPEDIPLLIRHLLLKLLEDMPRIAHLFRRGVDGRLEPRISGTFVDDLVRHPLPGNVRELESILIQAVNKSVDDAIRRPEKQVTVPVSSSVPPTAEEPAAVSDDGTVTAAALREALERAEWNVTRAGRILGKHRNAVQRLMDTFGIRKE